MTEPTLFVAVAAGLFSFLSPCMLPVIPAFFAQLAGTSLGNAELVRRTSPPKAQTSEEGSGAPPPTIR
ncbi:hypothetical protein BH20ACT11_BH20ACT11_15290 [soil metagenome]